MTRICSVPGCGKKGQHLGMYGKDGQPYRRAKCHKHHSQQYGIGRYEYLNHRKNYCENIDSRLGYKCTSTIVWEGQLEVDHINGIHTDNRPENLQTLCRNCHGYKTYINEDWKDKTATNITTFSVVNPWNL